MNRTERVSELDRLISSAPLQLRDLLQTIWFLVQQVEPDVALPTLGFENGGAYFAWNPGERSLDVAIDLTIDGTHAISWFYVDHVAGDSDTTDKSPHLHGYLQYVKLFRSAEAFPQHKEESHGNENHREPAD